MPQPNAATPTAARIPVWSPGTYRAMSGAEFTFTDADLAAMAAGYAPGKFAAPLVKGHPATDDPAQGWAERLEWDGRLLWAHAERLDPAFVAEHRAGRYRKISPKFFVPEDPQNPTPGHYYLKHIGFLGAAAPANTTLPPADFSANTGIVFAALPELPGLEFSEAAPRWGFRLVSDLVRRLREAWIAKHGIEDADQALPAYLIDDLLSAAAPEPAAEAAPAMPAFATEEPPMPDPVPQDPQAAFAEREAAINAREAAIAAREAEIAAQAQAAHREACAAFAEQLADELRIPPREAGFVGALLAGIAPDATCAFAEGDAEVTAVTAERLRAFLSALPPIAERREIAAPEAADAAPAFAAPAGYQIDPAQAELHRRAKAYQKDHPGTDFAAAVAAVA